MTTSIRVPDTISKMDAADTYPIVKGEDVEGFVDLRNEVNSNTSNIEANVLNIKSLTKQGKTLIKSVVGDTPPDYDKEPHGNYVTVARTMTKTLQITTPAPTGGMVGGAVFTVYNEDTDNSIRISAGDPLDSINGGTALNVPPENFVSFVYELANRDFLVLEQGYIPASRLNIAAFVRTSLSNDGLIHTEKELEDAGFLKGLKVSSRAASVTGAKEIQFSGATVSQGEDGKALVSITGGGGGNLGISVTDGTTKLDNIEVLKLKGLTVEQDASIDTALLTQLTDWQSIGSQYGGKANIVKVEEPLEVYDDPDVDDAVRLRLKHGLYEPLNAPCYLAYMDTPEVLIARHSENTTGHFSKIFPMDTVVSQGSYISVNKSKKSIGIQDITGEDPNISAGTDYLIAYHVSLHGVAPSDGYVRIYLNHDAEFGQPERVLTDIKGQPMAAMRRYKKGDKLSDLDVVGIVNAKALKDFTMHILTTFNDSVRVNERSEGITGIMIQALTEKEKTGKALLQYEIDTQQTIEFERTYLGSKRMTYDWMLKSTIPEQSLVASTIQHNPDGCFIYTLSPLKVSVLNSAINLKDDGVNMADFILGKVFDADETVELRNKDVKATISMANPDGGYNVDLMKWTGKPDQFTYEIYKSRDGSGSPVYENGWELVESFEVPKKVDGTPQVVSQNFTVPSDANNYAIIVSPVEPQSPQSAAIQQFDLDVVNPFNSYILHESKDWNELHLNESYTYYKAVQDNQGYYSLRYTINNAVDGVPMPCGIHDSGKAPITLDTTVNTIAGSGAKGGEGALKFEAAGTATINTELFIWSEKPKGTTTTVTFWWASVGPDGTMAKIPSSETTYTLEGQTASFHAMKQFSIDAAVGDRMALRASASVPDGAYLLSNTPNKPSVVTKINFEALTTDGSYEDNPWEGVDLHQFDTVYENSLTAIKYVTNQDSVTFKFDVPEDVQLSILSCVKQTQAGVVRPVKNLDWNYNMNTKEMHISFGEVVDLCAVTIGLYL